MSVDVDQAGHARVLMKINDLRIGRDCGVGCEHFFNPAIPHQHYGIRPSLALAIDQPPKANRARSVQRRNITATESDEQRDSKPYPHGTSSRSETAVNIAVRGHRSGRQPQIASAKVTMFRPEALVILRR